MTSEEADSRSGIYERLGVRRIVNAAGPVTRLGGNRIAPEVAAANSNFVNFATGNAASLPLVDEAVRNDPGIYPPPEVMAKLFPDLSETDEYTRLLNRTWTRFTTGK